MSSCSSGRGPPRTAHGHEADLEVRGRLSGPVISTTLDSGPVSSRRQRAVVSPRLARASRSRASVSRLFATSSRRCWSPGIGNRRRLAANPARIAPQLLRPAQWRLRCLHPTPVSARPTLNTCALGRRLTRRTAPWMLSRLPGRQRRRVLPTAPSGRCSPWTGVPKIPHQIPRRIAQRGRSRQHVTFLGQTFCLAGRGAFLSGFRAGAATASVAVGFRSMSGNARRPAVERTIVNPGLEEPPQSLRPSRSPRDGVVIGQLDRPLRH